MPEKTGAKALVEEAKLFGVHHAGKFTILLIAFIFLTMGVAVVEAGPKPAAKRLLTEYMHNPLGIDVPNPIFSWQFVQAGRAKRQSAYQIQVADSLRDLESGTPNVWDTGKVSSSRTTGVPFNGGRLVSQMTYYWRVKVWDADGVEGDFSEPASFEMGLLRDSEWQGVWLAGPPESNGYHSALEPAESGQDHTKWVQVDLGSSEQFCSVVIFPCRPYNWYATILDCFGFPLRYKVEASDDPEFAQPVLLADRTDADQPCPAEGPIRIDFDNISARFVRFTATKLYRQADARTLFALAEMHVLDAEGRNLALKKPVTALDSFEEQGWGAAHLTDGSASSLVPRGVSPLFRCEFRVDKPVRRARAYVTGLGYYELYLNGSKVGDDVLSPAYTDFAKRLLYSTYDVTGMLRQGANAVGAMLGRGWYGGQPRFILQMNVDYVDGTRTTVVTNPHWKLGWGPIFDNSIYHGESYDARREQVGWSNPGFDDSHWESARPVDAPTQKLSAAMMPPIRVIESFVPKSLTNPKEGVWVFDFGQNFSGWCRLRVSGPSGTEVVLRHAELLYDDGTVNQENLRSAKATDRYILKGEGVEEWEPRFTYHGFRYVQVEGFPGTPDLGTILGRVVHTDIPNTGRFECSNPLINQIHRNSVWGYRTNWHSIPTDCPQRDERQGWMGDAHMTADMGFYNFDVISAYRAFLRSIRDAQGEDGRIPDTVPYKWGNSMGDPMWSAAFPLIVWDAYRHTGDTGLLAENYEGLRRYAALIAKESAENGFITKRSSYGDWVAVQGTPTDLVSTGGIYRSLWIIARIAELLGNFEEARDLDGICEKIAAAFNDRFYDPNTGSYGNASQFSNAWPLYLGIVPPDRYEKVLDNLVQDIMVTHNGHLTTGFIGARYLLEVLCEAGRADVAYTIVTREDYPGWGYMIANGATTIWELWELKTGKGMNSHNHPAFGFVSGWFYRELAGIVPKAESAGFEHYDVKPYAVGDLAEAKAEIATVRGPASSHWKRDDDGIALYVIVPPNSTASVFVPKVGFSPVRVNEGKSVVWSGGKYLPGVDGITSASDSGDWIRFEVGSGEYEFRLEAEQS